MKKTLPAAALAVAVLAGVGILWLRFHVAPGETQAAANRIAFRGDLLNYYFGMMELTLRRWASGEVPLWNPHACSGMPLLATGQAGAFYPGNWLGLFLPLERALPALLLGQCILGGWLGAWLFRAWGASHFAAGFGGVVFVFSCLLGQTFWPPVVATLVWAPWLLLSVEKLLGGFRFRWWAGLAAGIAAHIFAGFPQMVAYTFFLVAPVTLLRLIQRRSEQGWSNGTLAARVAMLGAAVGLGVGVAAVQLVPTLELVGQSARAGQLTPGQVHYLTALDPHPAIEVLRNAWNPEAKLPAFDFGHGAGYLGLATPIWLVLGIAAGLRSPMTWLWLGLGGLALALSDGYLGPARGLYEHYATLPVVGNLRTPERLRWLVLFCAVALAVRGLDTVVRPPATPQRRRVLQALILSVAVAAALGAGIGAAWRVAGAAAVALALLQWPGRRALQGAGLSLLAALMLSDLALATGAYGSLRALPARFAREFHVGARFPLPASVIATQREALGPRRFELLGFLPHVAASPSNGFYRISCYEPLAPAAWVELSEALEGRPSRGRSLAKLDPKKFAALYDLTGVTRLLVAGENGQIEQVNNDDALPRAYVAPVLDRVDRETALEHVRRADFDFRSGVLVEPAAPATTVTRVVPARVTGYAAEKVVIQAEADGHGLLVLTDTFFPGWEARVDGEPARIWRANGLHRAVAIGPGRHEIVFEYRPASFRNGAALSIVSALAIAAVGALSALPRARDLRHGDVSSAGDPALRSRSPLDRR